jgi:hypothetical protein
MRCTVRLRTTSMKVLKLLTILDATASSYVEMRRKLILPWTISGMMTGWSTDHKVPMVEERDQNGKVLKRCPLVSKMGNKPSESIYALVWFCWLMMLVSRKHIPPPPAMPPRHILDWLPWMYGSKFMCAIIGSRLQTFLGYLGDAHCSSFLGCSYKQIFCLSGPEISFQRE